MQYRNQPSIRGKLTILNTLVTEAVLLLACLAFGMYDRATVLRGVERNLSIQAEIVGVNSTAALVFDDPHTAESTLNALRAAPTIMSADIYNRSGQVFAGYRRDPSDPAPTLRALDGDQPQTYYVDKEQIGLTRRIFLQGKEIGRVAIRSDVSELERRRAQYIVMGAIVMLVALIAALSISWVSQRSISSPIVDLAGTARRVSTEKDYSVRAVLKTDTQEINVLMAAFNEMLTEIQERDRSLSGAQEQLENRVQQRTFELEETNKELEAFTYSVSHDLRAPLRHVSGFARLLEEHAGERLDAESHEYLRTIVGASTKMGRLIDDLLAFSRTGRCALAKRRCNLDALVRDASQEVTPNEGNNRAIEWNIHDLPDVHGDPALLRQVMLNLLSNAVKYSAPRATAQIEVGTNGHGPGEIVVFVRDNGVGFDPQYADKLFGVFQRLHSADEFDGTGIGLANVRRIVLRHGGRVWATSQPDHGATFYFSLPAQELT